MWITLHLKYVTNMIPENTNIMNEIYKGLESRIQLLEKEVHDMSKVLTLLYNHVKGTELDAKGGITSKLELVQENYECMEKRVDELEKKESVNSWQTKVFWIIVGAVTTIIIAGIYQQIKI